MPTILNIRHLTGSLAGRSQRIALQEGQAIRLGRNPENDIKFTDAADDSVSGTHAELSLEGGRLYLEDKRSSNGTYVNGAPCPPFQKCAVPDGSRIRLAKSGPEMQVVIDGTAAAGATAREGVPTSSGSAAASTAAGAATAPAKEAVGRVTMLREIDRARQEERDVVAGQLAHSRRSTGMWVALGLIVVLLLAGLGIGGTLWWNRHQIETHKQVVAGQLASTAALATSNVWAPVEKRVSPAVVHIRCFFTIRVPIRVARHQGSGAVVTAGDILWGFDKPIAGSGVLIKPGLVLTAKHVAEPWKVLIKDWESIQKATGAEPHYDLLDVQFPGGQQPLKATLVASSEESDLALLQIQPTTAPVVPIVASNGEVKVTDRISVISYPSELGQHVVEFKNQSGFGSEWAKVPNVTPTFVLGTVTHPMTGAAGPHYVIYDASVTGGSSGGAVLNDKGEIIGIVSQVLTEAEKHEIQGVEFTIKHPVNAGNQAVSPDDIRIFLRTHGMI